VLSSVAVGTVAAAAGVYAGPRVPERTNLDGALAATAAAAAAAVAWGLWRNQLLATVLPFLLVAYGLEKWRTHRAARGLDQSRTRRAACGLGESRTRRST
jgi:hypothetical protein